MIFDERTERPEFQHDNDERTVTVTGTRNKAVCYTHELDEKAAAQLKALCDTEAFADSKIRVMPDVHAGMGCVIGTTMTLTDKVIPAAVGVDIGCGMETVKLKEFRGGSYREKLDELIHREIPSGREIREKAHEFAEQIEPELQELRCARTRSSGVNIGRALRSIGTLGGGNHFIEIDSGSGALYLIIHSGSRHLGTEVASFYQDMAVRSPREALDKVIRQTIERMKAEGREREISGEIKRLSSHRRPDVPRDMAWVEGELFGDYIHDMRIVQKFADINRRAMADVIMRGMGWQAKERFATIHNYIDTDEMMLRKGAVSAKRGEKLLIPINMRDGCLICMGRGNDDWNRSAPHGAGRVMSRSAALETLSMEEYEREMKHIFTTSVSRATLDEAPMAYKSIEYILSRIAPTAGVIERISPVYNFKAAE